MDDSGISYREQWEWAMESYMAMAKELELLKI
jgi:hypothetical protein